MSKFSWGYIYYYYVYYEIYYQFYILKKCLSSVVSTQIFLETNLRMYKKSVISNLLHNKLWCYPFTAATSREVIREKQLVGTRVVAVGEHQHHRRSEWPVLVFDPNCLNGNRPASQYIAHSNAPTNSSVEQG